MFCTPDDEKEGRSLCTNKLEMRVKVLFNEWQRRGGEEDHRRMSSTEIESLEATIPNTGHDVLLWQ